MKQKRMKKLGSFLLAGAMAFTMSPTFLTEVHAAENQLPTKEQFATVEELKKFNTNNKDGETNPAKIYFGNNNQEWWIAGSQGEKELTLFAESPLATRQQFEPNWNQNKTYSEDWKCTYTGNNPADVYPNHYGASPLRTTLKGLESSYFTSKEQDLMKIRLFIPMIQKTAVSIRQQTNCILPMDCILPIVIIMMTSMLRLEKTPLTV